MTSQLETILLNVCSYIVSFRSQAVKTACLRARGGGRFPLVVFNAYSDKPNFKTVRIMLKQILTIPLAIKDRPEPARRPLVRW